MAATFFWRCEGTTLDGTHDFTAGDTTATLVNSGSIDASAARVGTYGLLAPTGFSGGATFSLADNGIFPGTLASPSDLVISFAWSMKQPTALYTTSGVPLGPKFQGTATNDVIQVITASSGTNLTLRTRNATSGAADLTLTGGAITADVWIGVVCRLDYANNRRAIELYDASGTLIDSISDTSTDLSSFVPADIKAASGLVFGQHSFAAANPIYYDNLIISDNYDAPLQNNLTISSYTAYTESTAVKKIKLLTHPSAASATGVSGWVVNSAEGSLIGKFTGASFEASLEAGEAVLKVPVSEFGGESLTTSDTPLVVAKNTTYGTSLCSATVIEE